MGAGLDLIENGRKGAFYRGVQRFCSECCHLTARN